MAGTLQYILDTNVFIEASRRYYSLDFAKPFWVALCNFARQGLICSIDKVYIEITKGDDHLKSWAQEDFSTNFLNTQEPDVLADYSKIVQWAQDQKQFIQRAKDVFMNDTTADTWVLAFALAKGLTIVTHEGYTPEAQKRIPIPNVCKAFSIGYCDTFKMLRELKFQF